jgi:hypothetical protein
VFATDIAMADLFVLMDTTGTMVAPFGAFGTQLSSAILPGIADLVPDLWYGLGRFDDYPVSPHGFPPDVVYELRLRMSESADDLQAAVDALGTHSGGDLPESQVPALWATATGEGLGSFLEPQTECEETEFGYPCFRRGALPIILLVTDAVFHNAYDDSNPYTVVTPEPPSYADTMAALNEIHAKLVTVWAGEQCEQLAWDTGSVTADDDTLVYSVTGPGYDFGGTVTAGFDALINEVPFVDVAAKARDDDSDELDATIFVGSLEPDTEGGLADPLEPTEICVGGLPTLDVDDDPEPDLFGEVLPGTRVCFHVIPAQNDSVPQEEEPQVFRVFVEVHGSDVTLLDTRDVYFVVPPAEPIV